ncbi:MAG TPA: Gfo/Idh/MocA family oxidoreductase [Candidatus Acidoferrales bacterium]|jgi:predicted dehydrogenase|nr:Gfo/Idh/MocA family oxidoreductase [Candidatus Acidoferrales bacterium]
MTRFLALFAFLAVAAPAQPPDSSDAKPLRVAIAGLAHGHASGFFRGARNRKDIQITGVFDSDATLGARYAKENGFAADIMFTDLGAMLDRTKPEAVATFTNTYDHAMVVEACALRHIPVMMEKPLAANLAQARAIQKAAQRGGIPVIVNYETTWYKSHGEIWKIIKEQKAVGEIRKMVAMDGHQGPKEINVQPEFFAWLSDPVKNGAGALFDFGCYGANLMTWLMDNQRPIAVTALAHTNKPEIYAHVDDEATILVQYPRAQGIIQASWNWPYSRKDFEVYGAQGYTIATGGDGLRVRLPGGKAEEVRTPGPLPPAERDSISYLSGVARGRFKPAGLNSLENNVIVVEILDAARESVRTGKTIALK